MNFCFNFRRSSVLAYSVLKRCPVPRKCNYHAMDLKEVVAKLNEFAPLHLAEKWDNVGLLVEPSGNHSVKSILLTNDLTENVLQEAIDSKANMIISYHPPIFVPLKRLTSTTFKERIVVKAVENRIAVYSPHTCFDAVKNGVNDWLASGLGNARVEPLEHSKTEGPGKYQYKLVTSMKGKDSRDRDEQISEIHDSLKDLDGVNRVEIEPPKRTGSSAELQISVNCSEDGLINTLELLMSQLPEATEKTEVFQLTQVPILGTGSGRLCKLHSPVTLSQLIDRVKKHLNLEHVRVAVGHTDSQYPGDPFQRHIQTIALCAGAGASVLRGRTADVYLTGEMSHHEVLDTVSRGVHVILCEHSNTERGFLSQFKRKLNLLLEEKVYIIISSCDQEPLQVH